MTAVTSLYRSLVEAEDRARQYKSLVAKLRDALGFKTGHRARVIEGRVAACSCGYSPKGYRANDQTVLVELHLQESWKRRAENNEE
jgi:hypothetical protein